MESKQNKKTWFVTGASKGLGLALVKQLLELGQNVAATSRNPEALTAAVGNAHENLLALHADLADDTSVKQAITSAIGKFGSLDVAVNNAGYGIGGSLEELSDEELRQSFDINVFGTINVIRNVLPHMREQKSGHIINISSIAGFAATTGWAAYAATKFAVTGLTEVLAEDVREFGITATVVLPGGFRTSFLDKDSIVIAEKRIDDYTAMREAQQRLLQLDGKQGGDPEKAATLMIRTAFEEHPPLRLILGSDAYKRATTKVETLAKELEAGKETTISTDF
ncbi:SDR family NAD(P)-dependent oxidoreductase [Flavobacterium sp. MFBS3-15]|uniref:SDR family NAD(P)-dependent oxidoreductase n=1 Tax=Flavobacterium sp. MFBS3-15 TaxID=2989816 RepID=UPI0022361D68|nr:SDR family NAD(P)-dependent oxidoreductase [Flavobacterium sp. MFBS3-15]MCW4470475.1 SDR family NAD(P)-dependent oxidoreductase [Flavobacterium sp. MFBS3-15]